MSAGCDSVVSVRCYRAFEHALVPAVRPLKVSPAAGAPLNADLDAVELRWLPPELLS